MLVKIKREINHLDNLQEMFETLHLYDVKFDPRKCVFDVASGKFLCFIVSQCGVKANPDKVQAILEMTPPKNIKKLQSLNDRVAALNNLVSKVTDKCMTFFKTLKKAFEWTDKY